MFGLQAAHDESRQPLVEALLGQRIRVISVDTEVARHYARLKTLPRVQNGALSDRDLYVAATAKVHGLVLATLNPSVFQRIDGLAVEDWSQPE
jgi:predicted nucleic acid-binding protein